MSENALTIRVHGFIFHMVRVLLKNKSWEGPIAYIKLKFNNGSILECQFRALDDFRESEIDVTQFCELKTH